MEDVGDFGTSDGSSESLASASRNANFGTRRASSESLASSSTNANFEVTIDWAVMDALDQYDLDPEEMLATMEHYTSVVESRVGEKG